MRIAFVMDDVSVHSNGTAVTALRYAEELRRQGHEVRMVAHGSTEFPLEEDRIPVVAQVADRQQFHFAKPDDEVFSRAFDGVDIVHVFLPFAAGRGALRFCRAHQIPVSAAFHLQPENITYNAWMGSHKTPLRIIYALFRDWLYEHVRHIHCPSQMIANQLRHHGYRAQLHVISNGVPAEFCPGTPRHPFDDGLFHILTVGRFAPEKDQKTLLEAVALCHNRDRIKVHLAGEGAQEARLRALGKKLPVEPEFCFLAKPDLIGLIRACDLYVHCSLADIEAMSCLEAIACGLPAVISHTPESAASQFAVSDKGIYQGGDAQELAERIDWWIEHPADLTRARKASAKKAQGYRIDACVRKFVSMEEQAIADDQRAYSAGEEL